MKFKKKRSELGPNPDPELYQDVKTARGWYRRRKRAKGTKLNDAMQEVSEVMKKSGPAAKAIRLKLNPWLRDLDIGSLQGAMAAKLGKAYRETGRMLFTYLKNVDMHTKVEFKKLVQAYVTTEVKKNAVEVFLKIDADVVNLRGSIFTDFYFELVLLWGDAMKPKSLRVDSVESPLFSRKMKGMEESTLRLTLPVKNTPWMAMLKVNCIEGNEVAKSPRHYAMKVLEVGE